MVYSGNSFFDRAEVKDMMAYFKLAVNPNDDESFKRVVNKPARAIGGTTVDALMAAANAAGCSLFKAAYLESLHSTGLRQSAIDKLKAFCDMVSSFAAEVRTTDAYELATRIADRSGLYRFYKEDTSIEGMARTSNVEELINSVQSFVEERQDEAEGEMTEKVTLDDFLENTALLSNVDVSEDEDTNNKVALMTVHSSKGLEFPYVYIAGLEENLFPSCSDLASKSDLEEERRLFYVALTRAKKAVALSFAGTRMRTGKHESNSPSRFVREIDRQYLDMTLDDEDFGNDGVRHEWGGFGSRFTGGRLDRYNRDEGRYNRDERPSGYSPSYGNGSRYGQSSAVKFERRPATGDRMHGNRAGVGRQESALKDSPSTAPTKPLVPKPAVIDENFVPVDMRELHVGERVEHNRFGGGIIKGISGTYPEMKAVIAFDNYGEKLLLLKYAKLRPEK